MIFRVAAQVGTVGILVPPSISGPPQMIRQKNLRVYGLADYRSCSQATKNNAFQSLYCSFRAYCSVA